MEVTVLRQIAQTAESGGMIWASSNFLLIGKVFIVASHSEHTW